MSRKGTYLYRYPIKEIMNQKGIKAPTSEQLTRMNINRDRWNRIVYQNCEPRIPELMEIAKWLSVSPMILIRDPKLPKIDESKLRHSILQQ